MIPVLAPPPDRPWTFAGRVVPAAAAAAGPSLGFEKRAARSKDQPPQVHAGQGGGYVSPRGKGEHLYMLETTPPTHAQKQNVRVKGASVNM